MKLKHPEFLLAGFACVLLIVSCGDAYSAPTKDEHSIEKHYDLAPATSCFVGYISYHFALMNDPGVDSMLKIDIEARARGLQRQLELTAMSHGHTKQEFHSYAVTMAEEMDDWPFDKINLMMSTLECKRVSQSFSVYGPAI
jgi:hypothetical protein